MAGQDETITAQVGELKYLGKIFTKLVWLSWVECALLVVLGLTFFSEYVPHWGLYLLVIVFYAFASTIFFLISRTIRVVVYIFDELRLVV
jgi:hypothetical protein